MDIFEIWALGFLASSFFFAVFQAKKGGVTLATVFAIAIVSIFWPISFPIDIGLKVGNSIKNRERKMGYRRVLKDILKNFDKENNRENQM